MSERSESINHNMGKRSDERSKEDASARPEHQVNPKDNPKELMAAAEQALLAGEIEKSLELSEQASDLAETQKDYAGVLNAQAYISILHKVQLRDLPESVGIEDLKRTVLLEELGQAAAKGLKIAEEQDIHGQPKSVVLLRLGDYYYLGGNFQEAANKYKEAVAEIKDYDRPDKNTIYAEYLGHYGNALGMAGDEKGLVELNRALGIAENLIEGEDQERSQEVRPFHKLIISSGILMRLAEVCLKQGKKVQAEQAFERAQQEAEELQDKYNIAVRLNDLAKLRKLFSEQK